MKATFTTPVVQAEDSNATGLRVPAEVIAALGAGKRPKVTVSLNGYTYRNTVAAYGDLFMLPLSAEHRAAAGVQAGDQVEVTIALDLAPRPSTRCHTRCARSMCVRLRKRRRQRPVSAASPESSSS